MGTTVTDGRGRMIVTATGMRTEVGKIGTLIEEAGDQDTPLEQKLAQLGRVLVGVVLALGLVIVLAGWLRGHPFLYMLEVGISLAIAAVPEGLLAVTTMTLALGMQRMARMRVLVRRLPAVETLGSTTVICTDKTGTLTQNEMTVRALQLGDAPGRGHRQRIRRVRRVPGRRANASIPAATTTSPWPSGSAPSAATRRIDRVDGRAAVLGDPTEAALIVAAEKAGLEQTALNRDQPRIGEIPFSSEAKRMVTIHRTPEGKTVAYVKGAPRVVLEASRRRFTVAGEQPLTPEDRDAVPGGQRGARGQRAARAGPRVPGAARRLRRERGGPGPGLRRADRHDRPAARRGRVRDRDLPAGRHPDDDDHRGPAGHRRRDRPAARDSTETRGAGQLQTVHGRDLAALDGAGLATGRRRAPRSSPASPRNTSCRIVEALQSQGEIVAMTGDGVNDAPGAAEGGHRRGDGHQGDGGGQGGGGHGHHRRQLRHHRRRRRAGPDHLREHRPVHPLPLLVQRVRDHGRVRRDHARLAACRSLPFRSCGSTWSRTSSRPWPSRWSHRRPAS